MINFICTGTACLAMYLGTGSTILNDGQAFVYRSESNDTHYYCKGSSNIYSCRDLKLPASSRYVPPAPDAQGRYQ